MDTGLVPRADTLYQYASALWHEHACASCDRKLEPGASTPARKRGQCAAAAVSVSWSQGLFQVRARRSRWIGRPARGGVEASDVAADTPSPVPSAPWQQDRAPSAGRLATPPTHAPLVRVPPLSRRSCDGGAALKGGKGGRLCPDGKGSSLETEGQNQRIIAHSRAPCQGPWVVCAEPWEGRHLCSEPLRPSRPTFWAR